MKRGVLHAGSYVSRTRLFRDVAEFSSVVSRKQVALMDTPKPTLAEKLKSSSQALIASSELVINRAQAKSTEVLRTLASTAASPLLHELEDQNVSLGRKLEDWKDDWGPDTLTPKDTAIQQSPDTLAPKDTPIRQKPPHQDLIPKKKRKKTSSSAPSVVSVSAIKREGLIDPLKKPVLQDLTPTSQHKPIAVLAHGLDRVLFNPGVHWLQDPRSRVYNFSPHLENIPKVTDFAFERLAGFISSSRDEDLRTLAKRENRMFAGSTSSLTGLLGHCYFLISGHKTVDISCLSKSFYHEDKNFTPGQRMPTSVLFNYKDGVYAIDSDSEDSSKNVLTWLGTLLEKFLTMSETEFNMYLRSSPPLKDEGDLMREAYRYAKSDKFVMRSQLDGVDRRLPGTGVFDIKTRACLPIRMDILNWEENSGYVLKSTQGFYESFEREYYDLIRSAFLKYGFQVRIGNMDGVIVAYHNTAKMFGFQYIPLEEMDQRLFGPEPGAGDRVFEKCVTLLECIVPEIVGCFPNQSVKCTFECEENSTELNIFIQPADWTPTEEQTKPPMRQLAIRAQSFLDESPVSGARAITSSAPEPWTLHWTLADVSDDQDTVRKNFEECMERKFRFYNIPSGVSVTDLPKYWSELNFGNAPKQTDLETDDQTQQKDFDYSRFRLVPERRITLLRDLARSGREFTEMMERAEAGKKKIVLGEPYDISDMEIEVYKEEEDRDVHDENEDTGPAQSQDLAPEALLVGNKPNDLASFSPNDDGSSATAGSIDLSRIDELDQEPDR
ncbi:mitochondrial protein Pet127-domain-containing protein [Mycena pura]|uniref:Mitochondrial protein Pet127-domain-containing protein n=1 Tax=Mycena pura TaxID=153505 RepID=A0AAD6VK87_9AGAR|nr:mitochondrial protein Pet127-domain-containing protein [Mycena pura]